MASFSQSFQGWALCGCSQWWGFGLFGRCCCLRRRRREHWTRRCFDLRPFAASSERVSLHYWRWSTSRGHDCLFRRVIWQLFFVKACPWSACGFLWTSLGLGKWRLTLSFYWVIFRTDWWSKALCCLIVTMHHVIRCLDSAWKHRLPWPSKESGRLFGAQRAYVGCAIARLRAAYGRTRTVAYF